jgi:hypothetical protein
VDGGLDEVGGAEEAVVQHNPLRCNHWPHLFEGLIESSCYFQRVRSVLAGDHHHDPRFTIDCGIANLWLRGIHHRRNISHPHGDAVLMNQRRLAQLRRRQSLALSLEHDPLFHSFNESSASHAGGSPRSGEYIVDREIERRETVGHDLDL